MARPLIHRTLPEFWDCYKALPADVQALADKSFALLKENPYHPSLHFKKGGDSWSARVSLEYRALALETEEAFYWYWIGLHDEYERLIR